MKWINLAFLHVYVHRSLFSNFPNLPIAPPLAAVRIWKQYNGSLRGRQINFWTGVGCGLGLRTAPGQSRTQIFSMSQKTLPYQLGSQMCQQFSDVCGCQRGGTVGPDVHPLDGAPVIWVRMSGHPYVCRQDVGVWGCDLGVCFRGVRG